MNRYFIRWKLEKGLTSKAGGHQEANQDCGKKAELRASLACEVWLWMHCAAFVGSGIQALHATDRINFDFGVAMTKKCTGPPINEISIMY